MTALLEGDDVIDGDPLPAPDAASDENDDKASSLFAAWSHLNVLTALRALRGAFAYIARSFSFLVDPKPPLESENKSDYENPESDGDT